MADQQPKPKVVLVFPNPLEGPIYSMEAPLALLAVAAPLKESGYTVTLIDERLYADPERQLLEAAKDALCVGVSTMTGWQLQGAIRYSKLLKEHYPDLPVVWGGYHPSLLAEQCAVEPYVNAVVRGQGEVTMREVVKCLDDGSDLAGVDGVTYCDSDGRIVNNPDREIVSVDDFPAAPYELYDLDRFFELNDGKRHLQFFSSQGCPYKCSFCVEPEVFGKWTGRAAEKTVDEIEAIYRRYNITHITFSDPNFFVKQKRVRRICELLIERGIDITWTATARTDQIMKIDTELAGLLKESGCLQICVGVESGSQQILDLIDKRTTTVKAIESNRILNKVDIQGLYSYMVGFPKDLAESQDEVMQTVTLIKQMRKDHPEIFTITFFVTPYPGTPIFNIALNHGLVAPDKTEDWADWEAMSLQTTWITEKEKKLVERCNNMYFPIAYPNRKMKVRMKDPKWAIPLTFLHYLSRFRCRYDFYSLPADWAILKFLTRIMGERKAGSQIDLVRG